MTRRIVLASSRHIAGKRINILETPRSQFDQTSLGLPTRDYFLQPSNAIYLEAYKDYLMRIAILLGASLNNATIDAEELIEFETQLASVRSHSTISYSIITLSASRYNHRSRIS